MTVSEFENTSIKQHSLLQSVLLHLLPGILILIFFLITAPLLEKAGAPAFLALLLAIAFVLVPFQLGYLLIQGKKLNGKMSLKGIVLYRQPLTGGQYVALAIPLFAWTGLIMMIVSPPIDNFFIDKLFTWLPDWFSILTFMENLDQYSKSVLMLTAVLGLVLNGLVGPIVEELYFRGYLLPRISHLGWWAPLVNIVLFSLYHFFTPWQNVGRILAFTPLYSAVYWKKNIYLGMIVHCAGNLISGVMMLALVLNA
jgi:membrane protease YdiL (CAAX protease family)